MIHMRPRHGNDDRWLKYRRSIDITPRRPAPAVQSHRTGMEACPMHRYRRWLFVLALGAPVLTLPAVGLANEENENHPREKVTMDQLPAAVKATIQKEAQGKQIEMLSKEQEHGATVYEAEITANGKGTIIEVAEDGRVIERKAHN